MQHSPLAAIALLVSVAVSGLRAIEPERPTVFPGKHWEVRAAKDLGLREDRLKEIAAYMKGSGMITVDGHQACAWGDYKKPRDVASAVKPLFTHFMLRAVELGKLASPAARLADFEPRLGDLNAGLGHKDRLMTFRHCANQISCYGVSEVPGTAFDYNDYQMALLFDTLFLRVYGSTYKTMDKSILQRDLTSSLQFEDGATFFAFGRKGPHGRLRISPRDFCRFGLLYLNQGRWQDRSLISAEHVRLATGNPLPASFPRTSAERAEMIPGQRSLGSRRIPDDQTDHYGSYSWAWWVNGKRESGVRLWPDAPEGTFAALGHHHGKRGMAVVPEWRVVFSWNDTTLDRRSWDDDQKEPHPLNEVFRLLKQARIDRR